MNKKVLMFTLIPLVLSVMVAPAVAKPIGPRGRAVEKNRHLEIPEEGELELILPSGVGHIWIDTDFGVMDSSNWKNATKFKIRKAVNLTVGELASMFMGDVTYENRWTYIELQVLLDFIDMMVGMGLMDETQGDLAKNEFITYFPEGMYYKFVNVGMHAAQANKPLRCEMFFELNWDYFETGEPPTWNGTIWGDINGKANLTLVAATFPGKTEHYSEDWVIMTNDGSITIHQEGVWSFKSFEFKSNGKVTDATGEYAYLLGSTAHVRGVTSPFPVDPPTPVNGTGTMWICGFGSE